MRWLVFALAAAESSTGLFAQQPGPQGWELALDWLQARADSLTENLDTAQRTLKARATRSAPKLLARITPKLPEPRPHGYGLLPEIHADVAVETVKLHRNEFSITRTTTRATPVFRDGFVLKQQAASGEDLDALVREFERLRGQLTFIRSQIAYHRYWQKAVVEHARYFELRNRILPLADELKALVEKKGDAKEIEKRRVLIEAKVAPFQKTVGLKIETRSDGSHVLPVTVWTDIDDDPFLAAFAEAVRVAYNESPAAKAAKFRIELTVRRRPAATLYEKDPPKWGSAVDENEHVGRFAKDELLLTTGAKSTHAFVGRYIQLGNHPTSRRELAHEFGHLLGFSDAYLRGYVGTPGSRLGCTVVEWGGLQDNLMGSPARGQVTASMISRLIAAYR